MANVDHVEVAGGIPLSDVVAQVAGVLGQPALQYRGRDVITVDDRSSVSVYASRNPDAPGVVLAEVHYAGELGPRRELAQKVYVELAAATSWDLTWSSDDQDGDGIVAHRSARAA